MNLTGLNRTYQQLPDSTKGYDIGGNVFIDQPVSVSSTYPGMQVVTVTGAVDRIYIQPSLGQVILIDALLATKQVVIQSSDPAAAPVGVAALVLPGNFGFLISNRGGWYFVPATSSTVPGILYLPPLSPTGDDGASISSALASGDVFLLPGGAYTITTPIDVSLASTHTLYVNGANLIGNMAPTGGTANSVIKSAPTIAGTGATTLNGAATVGADTVVVTAVAGALVLNCWIRIVSAAGAGVQSIYQVLQITGTTLTLDRPLEIPFDNLAVVSVVSVMPRDVKIIGPGTISGSGDCGIDFQAMRRGLVTDMVINAQTPGLAAARLANGLIFDLSSVECVAERCEVVGRNTVANTDVFATSLGMFGAVLCRFVGCQGRDATVAAVFLKDAYQCSLKDTDGTDCATALAVGLAVSSSVANFTPTDNLIDGGHFVNNAIGMGVAAALRLIARGFLCRNSATKNLDLGLGGTIPQDCTFSDFTLDGGVASGGSAVLSGTVLNPKFYNATFLNAAGAIRVFNAACDFVMRGATFRGCLNTFAYIVIANGGTTVSTYISDVKIFGRVGIAVAEALIQSNNGTGQIFFKNIDIQANNTNEICISQAFGNIVELDDVAVTNPNSVAGTVGFTAAGTAVTYRKGRVDFSATATPLTFAQTDQGTYVANNAVAVPVLFKDVKAGAIAISSRNVDGGTPGITPKYTITANTRVDFTAINLDTSTYGYKILS